MDLLDPLSLVAGLNAAWLVQTPKGVVHAITSPFHAEGVVAPLFNDRRVADAAATLLPAALGFAPQRLHSLWEGAQRLADQGFVGLLVDDQLPLYFVTTQPGTVLPTHVALPIGDELLVIGADGPTPLRRADVQPWHDLARADRLATVWLLGEALPFVGYAPDAPLLEFLPDGQPQPSSERGRLLAEAAGPLQTLLLFSSAPAAEWFWESSGAHLSGAGAAAEQLASHRDIPARLTALAAALPQATILLNPGRHRFYQGFFRRADEHWYLATINGLWRIQPPFHCLRVARRAAE